MSADATCRGLRSPSDGPLTMELRKGRQFARSYTIGYSKENLKIHKGSLPSLLSPPFQLIPLTLEVGPLNAARGSGEALYSPSRVWGGVPAENNFGAFSLKI